MLRCALVLIFGVVSACVESGSFTPLGELELTAPANAVVRDGGTVDVPLTVVRGTGLTEAISVRLEQAPAGISMQPLEIAAASAEGVARIAAQGVEPGTPLSVRLVAEAQGKSASTMLTLDPLGVVASIDRRFGTNGVVSLLGNVDRDCRAWSLPQGRVLVDTSALDGIGLTRLLPSGQIDTTFGTNGRFALSPITGTLTRSRFTSPFVFVHADGKIVIGATGDDPAITGRYDAIVLLRLDSNGALDTSFGSGGIVVLPGALRLWGLQATPFGEVLIWYSRISVGSEMAKYSRAGVFVGASPAFTSFSVSSADMMLQPDGKPVMVVNDAVAYSLVRLTTALQLDPTFGRNGVQPVTGVPLRWEQRSDGTYFGVGIRYDYPTPGAFSGYAIHFDSAWRPVTGFDAGGVTFTDVAGIISSSIETSGGTLVVKTIDGTVSLGRLLSDGKRDQDFGTRGWKGLFTIPVSTQGLGLAPAGPHNAYLSYAITGQSCEIYKLWR